MCSNGEESVLFLELRREVESENICNQEGVVWASILRWEWSQSKSKVRAHGLDDRGELPGILSTPKQGTECHEYSENAAIHWRGPDAVVLCNVVEPYSPEAQYGRVEEKMIP